MKPQYHAAASFAISSILYLIFKSWGLTLGSFVAGILIDVDSVFDYLYQRGFPITIKKFFHAYCEDKLLKVRLFHAWELLVILGAVVWLSHWNVWMIGIWVGVGQHLLLDKVNHGERFRCYSFIWRWKNGFRTKKIFQRKHGLVKKVK